VFLGTLYPLVIDALGAGKISVGPQYFEAVFVPLMAPALFLMGVGPRARREPESQPEICVVRRLAGGEQPTSRGVHLITFTFHDSVYGKAEFLR
jgi:cytochrome c-type biogenesis protein CcmF